MTLIVGNGYIKLGLDISRGEDLIQHALQCMKDSDIDVAKSILSRIGNSGNDLVENGV